MFYDNEIKERWKEYFKTLLNEENPRAGMDAGEPNDRRTTALSREEVKKALKGMNDGKATGLDNILVEVFSNIYALISKNSLEKLSIHILKAYRSLRLLTVRIGHKAV